MLRIRLSIVPVLLMGPLVPTPSSADPVTLTSLASSAATWGANGHEFAVVAAEAISWDAAAGRPPPLLAAGI